MRELRAAAWSRAQPLPATSVIAHLHPAHLSRNPNFKMGSDTLALQSYDTSPNGLFDSTHLVRADVHP